MGVLLYEAAHKKSPFQTETYARLKTISPVLLLRQGLNEDLKKICKLYMKKNPEERPTAREILKMVKDAQKKVNDPNE